MKSGRNKTIDMPLSECAEYAARCTVPDGIITSSVCENKIYCIDFFDVSPRLPEKSFDLIIVDPPYNLRKNYAGEVFSEKNEAEYREFTRRWLNEIRRLASDTATVYVCCDWRSSVIIAPVLKEFFEVRNRITWQREKGRGAAKNWKNCIEDIWFCTVGKEYYFDVNAVKQRRKVIAPYRENGVPKDWTESDGEKYRMTCPSNFWDDITVPFWSMPENTAHPTQKPEKLIAKLVLASSREGDRVLDPFSGAGTTAVVCKKLGRRYTGIEKSGLYCAWSEIRLERADTDTRIQGVENGIFVK